MSAVRPPGGAPIEFWFDFSSGYAYFAALEIEALARRHGRAVLWRPFTLGAAFKVTGVQGLSRTPLKRDYARRDWQRLARRKGVAFNLPDAHPRTGLPAIRAFYYVDRSDARLAAALAKSIIVGYFTDGLDTDDPEAVARVAAGLGIDPAAITAGIADAEVKARARQEGEQAVARGVFGSPWLFIDGEPFWGNDRLAMVEQWLAEGPW
jgi:2-hydroxychromene-2-carboxylate isomerase